MNGGRSRTRRIPLSTYRLQLNSAFTFNDAAALVPYLRDLGVTHCYASPYLKARAGSPHGYDIVDHAALNPEIGSEEDFNRFVTVLTQHDMGHIMDLVPNHMAVGGGDNAWWLDVLENGEASSYAEYFDIDWNPLKDVLRGKVLCPVLGDHYGAVLEKGLLMLVFDAPRGCFSVFYYDHHFPIDPMTYPQLLLAALPPLRARLDKDNWHLMEFESLISAFSRLPMKRETAPQRRAERQRDKEVLKQRLARLGEACPDIVEAINEAVAGVNGKPGDAASFDALHALLEQQAYRLAYWQVADDEVNYRRFFDVNALAGVRVEQPEVFAATHDFVLSLIRQGKLDGLRIDHPDGLYDPLEYYERLQAQAADGDGEPVYIVVEKILANHEHLREEWPVQGTTGYEFANLVNGVFVYADAERSLRRLYERFIGQSISFEELLYDRKKLVMRMMLAGQLAVLANLLDQISEKDRRTRDFTRHELRNSLTEIVAWFPVYRTYVRPGQVTTEDRRYVEWAVAQAQKRAFIIDRSIFDYLRRCLLLEGLDERAAGSQRAIADFAMKFQQYSAPVMAKGMEDTAFYSYNRLISLNEVGGDPARFGVSLAAFHHANQERARRWPHTLLSTSTHDTKRSEDVRARINVLSELAAEWKLHVTRWSRINRARKRKIDGQVAPSRNDEYLLYQTLIGAWPLEETDDEVLARFADRIDAYMLKAMREAKVRTSWRNPNAEYEAAVSAFVRALLANRAHNLFLGDFVPFQQRVARYGMLNSLSQTLLKLTVPGVPDLYQGNEIWDFSLVDPDNRRPVDYDRRRALLTEIKSLFVGAEDTWAAAARGLLDRQADGCTKLYVTWRMLGLRRDYPDLFRHGRYQALVVHGPRAEHLCAYARVDDEHAAIVVAPRWFARLEPAEALPLGDDVWGDNIIDLSPLPARAYRNVLTGETVPTEERDGNVVLPVRRVLAAFPLAVLLSG